jgi:surface protein
MLFNCRGDDDTDDTATDDRPFITTWLTTTDSETVAIPINTSYTYNYTVNWGDGTIENNLTDHARHSYEMPGTYTVEISGTFPAIKFSGGGTNSTPSKLQTIEQWGGIEWASMIDAFEGCRFLTYNATDAPNLSNVTNMSSMFSFAWAFNGDLSSWDTSNVTNMSGMFAHARAFNGDISTWDTSNVDDMGLMFTSAWEFNGDLSNWDVSNVTIMRSMFAGASVFNSDLSNWDVGSVIQLQTMFSGASAFNGDISNWDVGSVTIMDDVFKDASNFNADLSNWNVSRVEDMRNTFENATVFNQDLSGWNTSNVIRCEDFALGSALTAANLPTQGCFGL